MDPMDPIDPMPQKINPKPPMIFPIEIHILIAEELCEIQDVISFLLTSRSHSSLLLGPLYSLAARSTCALTALLWAIVKRDVSMLRALLSHGPRGMTLKTNSGTVLHHVSRRCTEETIKRVLNEGTNLTITKRTGARKTISGSPLHWAARIGHGKLLQLLLDSGANVAALDQLGHTALHWAASMGNIATVKLLLSHGAERLVRGKFGDTPLDRARYYNHQDAVMLLLADSPVNHFYRDYSTPITLAASYHSDDIALATIISLISRGSDPCSAMSHIYGPSALANAIAANNPKTMSFILSRECMSRWPGNIPLYKFALHAGHPELAHQLITTAPPRFCDTYDRNLLHMALTLPECNTSLLKSLCEKGVPVNGTSGYGITPLTNAAIMKNSTFVTLLISHGAKVTSPPGVKTALHYAAQGPADRWTLSPPSANRAMMEIAKALLEASADINAQDDVGLSPLHEAVLSGAIEMVKLLLDAGADADMRDYNWQTPVDLAAKFASAGDEEMDIWNLLTERARERERERLYKSENHNRYLKELETLEQWQ